MSNGGWGSIDIASTNMLNQNALLLGGRGGWLINHRFTIGLAGFGKVNTTTNPDYDQYKSASVGAEGTGRFYVGYAGLLLEPIIKYRSPLHISLPVIIGAGGAGYGFQGNSGHEVPDQQGYDRPVRRNKDRDAQAFFVLEPGTQLELNMTSMVRLAIGASYRYTSDLDLPATAKDALHGLNVGLSIKVGSF